MHKFRLSSPQTSSLQTIGFIHRLSRKSRYPSNISFHWDFCRSKTHARWVRTANNTLIESRVLTNSIAEQQFHQVPKRPFNKKFNGVEGEYGNNAFIWLLEVERHREKVTSPSMCLQHIDRHLEGEAAHWVLNTPNVRILIYKGYMELATEPDLEAFHEALTQRFKLKKEEHEAMRMSWPRYDLSSLHQSVDASETLDDYYSRTRGLLIALHGRDDEYDTLTPPEITLRRIVIAQFVRNLRDDWPASKYYLQNRLYQQQVLDHRVSLPKAFKMAKAESKRMDLEMESKLERKRKLATDEKDPDNVKKQKHTTTDSKISEVPPPDQYSAVSSESNSDGECSDSGDEDGQGNVAAVPSKSPPSPPKSKPDLEAKPSVKGKGTS